MQIVSFITKGSKVVELNMLWRFLLDCWSELEEFLRWRGLLNTGKTSQSSFSNPSGRGSCVNVLQFWRGAILSVVPCLNCSSFQFSLYALFADLPRPVISKSSAPGVGGGDGNGCETRLEFSLGWLYLWPTGKEVLFATFAFGRVINCDLSSGCLLTLSEVLLFSSWLLAFELLWCLSAVVKWRDCEELFTLSHEFCSGGLAKLSLSSFKIKESSSSFHNSSTLKQGNSSAKWSDEIKQSLSFFLELKNHSYYSFRYKSHVTYLACKTQTNRTKPTNQQTKKQATKPKYKYFKSILI